MYYLQSRYCDPAIGRFISADSYVSTGQGLLGYNMYSYCNNNPIMNIDPTGEISLWIGALLVGGAILGGFLGGLSDKTLGGNSKQNNNDVDIDIDETLQSEDGAPTNIDNAIQDDQTKLTTGEKIANIAIGASLGLATVGAALSTGGVLVGAFSGIGASYLGVTAVQGFAIGALAVDTSSFFVLPLFCIEIPSIEYETPNPPQVK